MQGNLSETMKAKIITKILLPTIIILSLIAAGIHFIAPVVVQKKMMGEFNKELFSVKKGYELHPNLFIADMHADTLLWERDFFSKNDYGHVDLPRMMEGNVALQIFTIVTKAPKSMNIDKTDGESLDRITPLSIVQMWPISTWYSLFARAIHQISRLKNWQSRSMDNLMIIKTQRDLKDFIELRTFRKRMVGAIIGLEGAHAIEGSIKKMEILYREGLRVIGLTHFFDNKVAGSAHGEKKGGLTEFGRKVVKRANELGLIFDVSHLSEKATFELLELSTRPVINTHTGFKGKCKNERNLSDELAKAIAEKGGIIGVGFWDIATCGTTTRAIVDTIKYATDLVGVDHIALGSDFDGTIVAPIDISKMESITSELSHAGYTNEDIAKIMGGNVRDFFLKYLPQN